MIHRRPSFGVGNGVLHVHLELRKSFARSGFLEIVGP
jgi:hypothetical protein